MQIWIKGKACINNHSSFKLLRIQLVLPGKNWWKNSLTSTRLWSLTSTSKRYHSNDLFQLCLRWIDYFYYWFLTRQLANQTTVEPSQNMPLKYGKKTFSCIYASFLCLDISTGSTCWASTYTVGLNPKVLW